MGFNSSSSAHMLVEKRGWAAVLVLPLISLWGIIGNSLVCLTISREKKLHNATNYFLCSLAVADLLVSVVVMPFSIWTEFLNGQWSMSFELCLFHICSDVFLTTSSILHMTEISLHRYWGISKPLKSQNQSKYVVPLKITMVWLLSLIIASPILVMALGDKSNVYQQKRCKIFNSGFMISGSVLAFLVPLLAMTVAYKQSIKVLHIEAKMVNTDAALGLRKIRGKRSYQTQSSVYNENNVKDVPSCSCQSLPNQNQMNSNQGIFDSCSSDDDVTQSFSQVTNANDKVHYRESTCSLGKMNEGSRKSSRINLMHQAIVKRLPDRHMVHEQKAKKVLSLVLASFFICWTPFFVNNFIVAFCNSFSEMSGVVNSVALWLGYISSTINPIIYTMFSNRFRQGFKRTLFCYCSKSEVSDDNMKSYQTFLKTSIVVFHRNAGTRSDLS